MATVARAAWMRIRQPGQYAQPGQAGSTAIRPPPPPPMFIQLAQVSGSLLILTAFVLAQFCDLGAESPAYLGLNLTGSLALAILAATGGQWGFLLLEGTWAAISAFRLISVSRGASDVPMNASELAAAQGGPVTQVPDALGAEGVAYNLDFPAGARLRLTGPVLAAIYLGQITHWNDPASPP